MQEIRNMHKKLSWLAFSVCTFCVMMVCVFFAIGWLPFWVALLSNVGTLFVESYMFDIINTEYEDEVRHFLEHEKD